MAEQSDPLFAPARLLITTSEPSIEILAQEILLHKYKERVERPPQQDRLIKICTDAGFLKTVEVGQYFMTKHTDDFFTICRASDMSWVHFTTRWKIDWPERLESREHKNWTLCWKSQPVTCKVKMEWKLELNLWTKTILTRGSEFLWIEQVGHRFDRQREKRQRARDLWNEDGSICVEDGSICVCKPIKC